MIVRGFRLCAEGGLESPPLRVAWQANASIRFCPAEFIHRRRVEQRPGMQAGSYSAGSERFGQFLRGTALLVPQRSQEIVLGRFAAPPMDIR